MKLISFFSGIGAFEKALVNLGIPYELVAYCEIDKFASKSYSAIHGVPETRNLGDITKVDAKELPSDIDLLTYGFPCQDISNAGLQKGLFNEDGSKTRSGLFFDALRIIKSTQPKVAIAENVKNLTSKKFANQFKIVLDSLSEAGYYNYWAVLNAKDFGVPQNRERVFIVSIRKDLDKGFFNFPEGFPLEKRLKDVLEDDVDEKYFLQRQLIDGLVSDVDTDCIDVVGMLDMKGNECVRRVYGTNGIFPTLNTMQGGHRQPKILIREATKKGYAEALDGDSVNLEYPNSKTRRGRVGKQVAQTLTTSPHQGVVLSDVLSLVDSLSETAYCLDANYAKGSSLERFLTKKKRQLVRDGLRIRKLTPKECFRLMGFSDEDYERAAQVNSNSQLYKQAGNSIVVDVLEHLLQSIFEIIK